MADRGRMGTGRRDADSTGPSLDDGAEAVIRQLLTALERSAPAEPGYGEIQYRERIVAQAKTWLAENGRAT